VSRYFSGASMRPGTCRLMRQLLRSSKPCVAPSLDGTPTLNQWVLIQELNASPSVITIECCGLLVGSTSEEIAAHIRASWITGT
jgi:hypothetical protein